MSATFPRICLVLALVLPGPLAAQSVNLDQAGVAINGYDPVAYFSDSAARKGSNELTATHAGATYRFSSSANRDAFVVDPERYVPAYGGFCAFGVSRGYKVNIDPQAFRVVNGRLYLNYSRSVQKEWLADIPGYITKADGNWVKLKAE